MRIDVPLTKVIEWYTAVNHLGSTDYTYIYIFISSLYIHWYIGWILGISCDIITKQDGNLTNRHAAWPTTIEGSNGGHWTKWKIQNACNDIMGSVLHGDFGFHGFQNVFQNGFPLFLQGDLPGPFVGPLEEQSHTGEGTRGGCRAVEARGEGCQRSAKHSGN